VLTQEEVNALKARGKNIQWIEQPGGGAYYPTERRPPQVSPEGREWTREDAEQAMNRFFNLQKARIQGIQEAEEDWRQ
jgi:hypothetical protein